MYNQNSLLRMMQLGLGQAPQMIGPATQAIGQGTGMLHDFFQNQMRMEQQKKMRQQQGGSMAGLGTGAGMLAGALLAPYTGGLSMYGGAMIGGGIGGGVGSMFTMP